MSVTNAQPGQHTPAGIRWFLVGATGVHAGFAVLQPFLAGAFLSGLVDAIGLHNLVGLALPVLALLQALAAGVLWRFGGGPLWPLQMCSVLVGAEVFQIVLGYSGALGIHLPLGVAIVGGSVALFLWSLLRRPVMQSGVGAVS